MQEENRLGDYLRARRELVTPEDVGLPAHGLRRVPGLRREEVAMLAGISAEYYLRLEQGRDRNPSLQVLEALARVLRLDETAVAYLLQLVAPRPRTRARAPRRATVPPHITQLLATIGLPAFAADKYFDVLAANPAATALTPNVRVGENRLRSLFLDPAERSLHLDWAATVRECVAAFRRRLGSDIDDPRAAQLVGELSLGSEEFRRVWARHDVKPMRGQPVRMSHPLVGDISLGMSKLDVDGTDGMVLVVFHPEPGTGDAERLALLTSLTAEPSSLSRAPIRS